MEERIGVWFGHGDQDSELKSRFGPGSRLGFRIVVRVRIQDKGHGRDSGLESDCRTGLGVGVRLKEGGRGQGRDSAQRPG